MFHQVKIDDFHVLEYYHISRVMFRGVEFSNDDFDIKMDGDRIIVDARNIGGQLTGHSWKRIGTLFPAEEFDFDFNIERGGIRGLHIEYGLDKQFVDGRTLPLIKVLSANFDFDQSRFKLELHTDNIFVKLSNFLLSTFKDAWIAVLQPILNTSFPLFANIAIESIQN